MSEANEFRAEVAAWLADNCPEGARGPGEIANGSSKVTLQPDTALWLERMAERGWTAPTWPTEYGGGGLSTAHAKILYEEMAAIKARGVVRRGQRSNDGQDDATVATYKTEWSRPGRLEAMLNWYRASPLQVAAPGAPITDLAPLPLDRLHIRCPHLLPTTTRSTTSRPATGVAHWRGSVTAVTTVKVS